ncbi:hypothetical protein B0H13DRAFT_1880247 [Mycena leptocephala]|nr:hypothetical protein B0H13DRAFT_1880247 [Mycena leptocephala]
MPDFDFSPPPPPLRKRSESERVGERASAPAYLVHTPVAAETWPSGSLVTVRRGTSCQSVRKLSENGRRPSGSAPLIQSGGGLGTVAVAVTYSVSESAPTRVVRDGNQPAAVPTTVLDPACPLVNKSIDPACRGAVPDWA